MLIMFKEIQKLIIYLVLLTLVIGCNSARKRSTQQNLEQLAEQAWGRLDSVLLRIQPPEIPDNIFNVTNYGAIAGDGINDKPAFDSCIAVCSNTGGGIITVPDGNYFLKGPIHLESNMHLKFDSGAYLRFSENPDHYLPVVLTSWEGTRLYNYSPLIYAKDKKNIAITGNGILDGNAADTWVRWQKDQRKDQLLSRKMNHDGVPLKERIFGKGHKLRTHFMQFYECENILVEDITITDSPFWCIHPIYSQNVIVRNVTFDAQNLNNDGIDPESSQYVLIEDITFSNKDDNVAIKAGRDHEARKLNRPSRYIIVRNCRFQGHNAMAIGSEMSGGVSDIYIKDCSFAGPVVKGIYLKSNKDRGSAVHDIFVRNVDFGVASTVIEMDSDYKNEGEGFPPSFYNVVVEDVTCMEATEFGIYIKGPEQEPVRDVLLKDVRIMSAKENILFENAEDIIFENVTIGGSEVYPKNN